MNEQLVNLNIIRGIQDDSNGIDPDSFYHQLYKESIAMAKYALSSGKVIPPGTIDSIPEYSSNYNSQHVKPLIQIHAKLGKVVAPAKPRTILHMEEASLKKSFFSFMGPFPLIKRLMAVAILFLGIFIWLQTTRYAQFTLTLNKQTGLNFILPVLDLVAAAGLGASFAALFRVDKFSVNGTYENKYEVSYWIRFVLGIISGLTLSLLIDFPLKSQMGGTGAFNLSGLLVKPLLAMLGGFSANLVYRIFNRLIELLESLITGSMEEASFMKEQEFKSRMKAMEEDFSTRQEIAVGLINVLKDITDPDLEERLKTFLETLIPIDNEN